MNTQLLKKLYGIHSPSGCEHNMRKFIVSYAKKKDADCVTDKTGNVYVTKGNADNYPCIVAHMDQVQRWHSPDFLSIEFNGAVFGYSEKNHRFEGLGADDKNGIFVALECLQEFDVLKCAFFVGEEIGCVGSFDCDMTFFNDCRFVLQCDRRNGNDLITEITSKLCSDEFLHDIDFRDFGYKETQGAMTDVDTLKCNGLAVSCVNMSCGYYNPHTDEEITDLAELQNCLNFVKHIIRKCTDVYPHTMTRGKWADKYGYWDRWADNDECSCFTEDMWETITNWTDVTAEELMEIFRDDYPPKTREDYQKEIDDWHAYNDDAEFPTKIED